MPPYGKHRRHLSFKYHGLYCGPGWSDGKYQSSVCGYAPAVDEFDQTCKEHDCLYASGADLKDADESFYRRNIGGGIKRTVAALGVGAQGFLRSSEKMETPKYTPRVLRSRRNSDVVMRSTASVATQASLASGAEIESSLGGKFNKTPITDRIFRQISKTMSGITTHFETRGGSDGAEIVWFGHATIAYVELHDIISRSLLKMLVYKSANTFSDFNNAIGDDLAGVVVGLRYHTSANTLTLTSVVTAGPFVAGDTFFTLAAGLGNLVAAAASANPDIQLIDVRLFKRAVVTVNAGPPATGTTGDFLLSRVNLHGLKMRVISRSLLAVQNTTLGQSSDADNDTTQSVTAAPLSGRIYHFRGNYARKVGINQDPADLVADSYMINNVAINNPTATAAFSEPVDRYSFYGAKSVRQVQLNSGQIKTDQMSSIFTLTLRNFYQSFSNKIIANFTHNYGHLHLFAMEKSVFIANTNPITVALNLDTRIAAHLIEQHPKIVQPIVEHVLSST